MTQGSQVILCRTLGCFQVQYQESVAVISPRNLSEDCILKDRGWLGAEGYDCRLGVAPLAVCAQTPSVQRFGSNRKQAINPRARKTSLIPKGNNLWPASCF